MSSPFNMPDESFQGFFKAGRNLLKALTPLPSPPGEAAALARGTPLAQRQMDCLQQQLALWARGPRPRAAALHRRLGAGGLLPGCDAGSAVDRGCRGHGARDLAVARADARGRPVVIDRPCKRVLDRHRV